MKSWRAVNEILFSAGVNEKFIIFFILRRPHPESNRDVLADSVFETDAVPLCHAGLSYIRNWILKIYL